MCIPHIHTKYLHSCSRIIKSFRLGKTSKVRLSLCVRLRQCWYQLPVVHVLPISRSKCALTHVHTTLCTPSSKHNLSFAHSQNKQIHGKIIIMYILSLTHAAIPTNLHALSPSTHPSWPPPLGMQEVWESITIYSPSIHHCQVCSPLFAVTDKQSKDAGHQYAEEGRWALCQHKKQEDTAESSWGCSCLLQPTEQSCHCPRNILLYSQDINCRTEQGNNHRPFSRNNIAVHREIQEESHSPVSKAEAMTLPT